MIITSRQLMFSKSQILMVIIIIKTCIFISIYIFIVRCIYWFRFIAVLIYIRGIIVLFIFVVSLAPNEKGLSKKRRSKKTFITVFIITIILTNKICSERTKTNSAMEWRISLILILIAILIVIAYLPPKTMNSFYKGMKSSK